MKKKPQKKDDAAEVVSAEALAQSSLDQEATYKRMATAYHEAGHAIMAVSLGRSINKVTIKAGNSRLGDPMLGVCEIKKGRAKASKNSLADDVMILFAGMVSEARFTGKYCASGATQDLRLANRLLRSSVSRESQLERLQRRLLDKTEHVLNDEDHVQAIELVASELIANTTISGRAVRHLFEQATKGRD